MDVVQDRSKGANMDDYAIRYPTNVVDIASFLVRLTGMYVLVEILIIKIRDFTALKADSLPPILHYSANEPFTKYDMCKIFANILGLSLDHIKPVSTPPTGPGATTRPYNCHLSTAETEKLLPLQCSGFRQWWEEYLTGSSK